MEQVRHEGFTAEERVARVIWLSRLGLSTDEIVSVMRLGRAFIKDTLASPSRQMEPFFGSPYARSFSAYMRVWHGTGERVLSLGEDAGTRLVNILKKKAKVDALVAFLKKMESLARRICNPVIPEALVSWHGLLSAIFPGEVCERDDVRWMSVWYEYIGDLRSKRVPYPESYRGTEEALERRYGEVIARCLRPRWTSEMGAYARDRLTEALGLLSGHNEEWWQVLCRHHGLGGFEAPSSLLCIAAEERRHMERIRQKYLSGLNFLAALLRRTAPGLDRFVLPEKGELASLYVQRNEENRRLREKLAFATFGEKAALVKKVDELGFSARTGNCLWKAHRRFVWVLVQHRESELLEIDDFGEKSIDEVRRVLAGLGLSLGMEFDEEIIAELREQTEHIE